MQNQIHAPAAKGGQMATRDIRAPRADDSQIHSSTGHTGNRLSAGKTLRRMILAGCLGMVTFTSIGCTASSGLFRKARRSDCLDDFMVRYRNRVMAEKAWHCRKDRFGSQANDDVYKAGFIAGYLDIAEGGEGCTPLVAPREYWGWRYQSAGGQGAVGGWFAGWPMGVQAAEQDGLGTFTRLPSCGDGCGGNGCGPQGTNPTMAHPVMDGPVHDDNPFYPDAQEMGHGSDDHLEGAPMVPGNDVDSPALDGPSPADVPAPAIPQAKPDMTDSVLAAPAEAKVASLPTVDEPSSAGVSASFDDSTETISIEEIFGLAPPEAATIETSDSALPFSFE